MYITNTPYGMSLSMSTVENKPSLTSNPSQLFKSKASLQQIKTMEGGVEVRVVLGTIRQGSTSLIQLHQQGSFIGNRHAILLELTTSPEICLNSDREARNVFRWPLLASTVTLSNLGRPFAFRTISRTLQDDAAHAHL